jgi:hypothetical protein
MSIKAIEMMECFKETKPQKEPLAIGKILRNFGSVISTDPMFAVVLR